MTLSAVSKLWRNSSRRRSLSRPFLIPLLRNNLHTHLDDEDVSVVMRLVTTPMTVAPKTRLPSRRGLRTIRRRERCSGYWSPDASIQLFCSFLPLRSNNRLFRQPIQSFVFIIPGLYSISCRCQGVEEAKGAIHPGSASRRRNHHHNQVTQPGLPRGGVV